MKTVYNLRNIAICTLSLIPFCWILFQLPDDAHLLAVVIGAVWGVALWVFVPPVDWDVIENHGAE